MKIAFCAAALLCAAAAAAELPVRTVVLYKHGVGYFERDGMLAAGESARLDFRAGDMNDVLKSLTIDDQGGKVTGLRYDSSVPLDRKLADFPFRIDNGEPLSGLLDRLKGARIELELAARTVAGAIVSARLVSDGKDRPEREQLTLLLDSGELQNVDLSGAAAIRFADPALQLQLKEYLAAVAGARSQDKRAVYIDSTDSKARHVRAAYILPMPAWKSSYRLLFGQDGAPPTLEGWAIVDNTTGEDWTNVRMSLVSGRPISFVSQLYAPKFVARPGAELPEDRPVSPEVFSGAVQEADRASAPVRVGGNVRGLGTIAGVVGGVPAAPQPYAQPSSVAAAGPAQELADLFEYSIAAPVTVHRDESAMLPFLQRPISARKLVIYSDSTRPNPFSAAELTNNTGETLDGGPITVFDAGAYAGEALIETVKSGDKRFITYGLDLGARVSTTLESRNDTVRELHVHNGLLISKVAQVQKKTYSVRNIDPRAKTLIVEHPVRAGYSLIDTARPIETARDVYRFEIQLPAKGSVDFPVTEEHVFSTQVSVSSLGPDGLLVYVRNQNLGEAARKQLRQIADLKTQIASADSGKQALAGQIDDLARDEERSRQNIASLSPVAGQQQIVQDYARKLSEQETQIAQLRDRANALDRQRAGLQEQLNTLIEKVDF